MLGGHAKNIFNILQTNIHIREMNSTQHAANINVFASNKTKLAYFVCSLHAANIFLFAFVLLYSIQNPAGWPMFVRASVCAAGVCWSELGDTIQYTHQPYAYRNCVKARFTNQTGPLRCMPMLHKLIINLLNIFVANVNVCKLSEH